MENTKYLIYDGSFEGFLTVVFNAFQTGTESLEIQREQLGMQGLFQNQEKVVSHVGQARSVWEAIGKKGSKQQRLVYFAFLSENPGREKVLWQYLYHLLSPANVNCGNEVREYISRLAGWCGQVDKEKGQLEFFLKFQRAECGLAFGLIRPTSNVLPLLSRHFRIRFKGEPWLIFDAVRSTVLWNNEGYMVLKKLNECPGKIKTLLNGFVNSPIRISAAGRPNGNPGMDKLKIYKAEASGLATAI